MNMKYVLQKINSFMLFFFIIIIFLKLKCWQKRSFKSIKDSDRDDKSYNSFIFISLNVIEILIFMHIFKHLNGCRPHRNIDIFKRLFVSSQQIPTKSFQIVFNHINVCFYTFLSSRHLMLFSYVSIDRVHKFIFMTWLLIKFNTKIEEKEFENILSILFCQIFEFFNKCFNLWVFLFFYFFNFLLRLYRLLKIMILCLIY